MLPRSWPYSAAPLPQYGPAVASCCAQNTANAPAAATPPPSPCHLVICTAAAALRPRWLPHLIAVLSLPKPAAAAAWLFQSVCHQSGLTIAQCCACKIYSALVTPPSQYPPPLVAMLCSTAIPSMDLLWHHAASRNTAAAPAAAALQTHSCL